MLSSQVGKGYLFNSNHGIRLTIQWGSTLVRTASVQSVHWAWAWTHGGTHWRNQSKASSKCGRLERRPGRRNGWGGWPNRWRHRLHPCWEGEQLPGRTYPEHSQCLDGSRHRLLAHHEEFDDRGHPIEWGRGRERGRERKRERERERERENVHVGSRKHNRWEI